MKMVQRVRRANGYGFVSSIKTGETGHKSRTHVSLPADARLRLLAILLGRPFLIAPQYIRMSFPEGPITIPDTPIRGSSTARFSEQGHLFRSLVSVGSTRHHKHLYLRLHSGIHAIQSSAVERLYDYNIDGPSRSSPREIMTARLDLTMELDEWCESLRQNIQVVRPNDPRGEARVSAASRWSIILSVHYYVTKLLINAPILSMALSEGQKLWLGNTSFSMIHKSAEEVLNDDFESAKELQHIIQETAGARIWGLGESPIWFICNYSSKHRSLFSTSIHMYALTSLTQCSVYSFSPCIRHITVHQGSRKRHSSIRQPPCKGGAITARQQSRKSSKTWPP